MFAAVAAIAYYSEQQAVRARKRAKLSLLIAASRSDLRDRNIASAVQNAAKAYELCPKTNHDRPC